MDFGLSEDQELFGRSLRSYLADKAPMERVRASMERADPHDGDLLAGLAAQGVSGVMVPEDCGGSGLGLLDAVIAAEELGRAAAPVSFHVACVAAPYLLSAAVVQDPSREECRRWLGRVAAGEATISLVPRVCDCANGRLQAQVSFVADAAVADAFIVPVDSGGELGLYLLPRETGGLSVEPLASVDATRGLGELLLDGVALDGAARLTVADPLATLDRALDAARIALAADALGAAERSLELAVEYSLVREQFGRAIGSFQAVKHMCAETFAEVEPLRALLWYAAFAWDEQREDAAYAAALLKSHATEAATEATTTCIQVYGGMGFTYDCDMHIWFKRAGYDRQMFGTPTELRERAFALQDAAAG